MARRESVRDIDRGYQKFKETMMDLKRSKPFVAVGVLGEHAWKPKEERDGKRSEATVVDVATFNEFGTSTIPARPFLRRTFENNQRVFVEFIRALRVSIALGKTSPKVGLTLLGQLAQTKVQDTISDSVSWATPNAPSTIERKGSTSPLMDTGQLRQSISFEVRDGN